MASPLLLFDRRLLKDFAGLVGVDEAGRGSLAGPVVAAAVWVSRDFYAQKKIAHGVREINDSKQISALRRSELAGRIRQWETEGLLRATWGQADVMEIATFNILGATRMAMDRALRALQEKGPAILLPTAERDTPLWGGCETHSAAKIVVDGRPLKPFSWQHEAIVEGDAKSLAIAMASIIAKTTRDALMMELAREFPCYGFAVHKGYGTPEHRDALKAHGPCAQHRALFLRKLNETDEGVVQTDLFA